MAKGSYTRRSTQGGRFRRQDFGDLGLRSYADQQKQIIDSIKIQRARAKEISSDYAQSMGDVAANEQRNRTILQDLENEAYETRRKAMDVRASREIEALEGKAKEYGKEKDRWLNFSKTEAAKWGMLAKGALATADKIKADLQWPEIQKQLDAIASGQDKAFWNIAEDANKDIKKNFKENPNISRNLIDVFLGSGVHRSEHFASWFAANKNITPSVGQEIAKRKGQDYYENPAYWNKLALNHLAARAGVKAGTPGYAKALKYVNVLSATQAEEGRNSLEATRTTDQIVKSLENLKNLDKTAPDYQAKLRILLDPIFEQASHGVWKDGEKYVRGGGNKALSAQVIVQALLESGHYSTFEDVMEVFKEYDTSETKIPGKSGKFLSFYDRHFERHGQDWVKGFNRWKCKKEAFQKVEQDGRFTKFNSDIEALKNLNPDSFQASEGQKSVALQEYGFPHANFNLDKPGKPGYKETRDWVYKYMKRSNMSTAQQNLVSNNILRWDASNTVGIFTHSELESAAIAGDAPRFWHIYAGLETKGEQKDINIDPVLIENLTQDFSAIQSLGLQFKTDAKELINSAEKGVKGELGYSVIDKNANARMIDITTVKLKEIFIHKTDRKLSTQQRFEDAKVQVKALIDNKIGVFNHTPGGNGIANNWHAVKPHVGKENIIPLTGTGTDNLVYKTSPYLKGTTKTIRVDGENKEVETSVFDKFMKDHEGKLVKTDTIDEARVNVLTGRVIPENEPVTFLAQRFGVTESTVWKKLGVNANPSAKDALHSIQPSTNSEAYKSWLDSFHTLEDKIKFSWAASAFEQTGVYPTTDWTRDQLFNSSDSFTTADIPFDLPEVNELKNLLEIDKNDKFLGRDVLQSSTRYPDGTTRPEPINVTNARAERKARRARISELKKYFAALNRFDLNSFQGKHNFIKNRRQFGGFYNAFTGETIWERGGRIDTSLPVPYYKQKGYKNYKPREDDK